MNAVVFLVTWTLAFTPGGATWRFEPRSATFHSESAARSFMESRVPVGVFECVDSVTGESGFCAVSRFGIEKRS